MQKGEEGAMIKEPRCEWEENGLQCNEKATYYIGEIADGKHIRPTVLCSRDLLNYAEGVQENFGKDYQAMKDRLSAKLQETATE
jgi:hypothetical protein